MTRLLNAWGALGRDQRLAAATSFGLFVSMLLPWYSKTVVVRTRGGVAGTQSLSAFQAFSFVEAAVLLVSVGVLVMLFARAEQREFQLPGGDGTIVMVAGAWVAILIFYRLFDKPGLQGNEQVVSSVGVQWGIFVALLVAIGLAYVGRRMRATAHGAAPPSRPRRGGGGGRGHEREREREPTVVVSAGEGREHGSGGRESRHAEGGATTETPSPRARGGEAAVGPAGSTVPAAPAGERRSRRERPRYPPPPSEQMSFEDAPPREQE
ncbi:MAG TPA: hypothetical protein VN672_04040 [Solirubrobacteraceae bacterium]|nr:hypothetical protein [Solirubrobacteraceae bacterium]